MYHFRRAVLSHVEDSLLTGMCIESSKNGTERVQLRRVPRKSMYIKVGERVKRQVSNNHDKLRCNVCVA